MSTSPKIQLNKEEKLINQLKFENEALKQFIQLTLGKAALDQICNKIDIDKTDRMLKIETPEQFNKELMVEKAILENV